MVRRRIAALLCVVFVLQMIAGGGSPLASFASELSGSRSEIMGTQSELPVSEDSAGAASGSSVEEKDASPAETASASESELLLPHAGELTGEMRLSGTIQIYGDVGQVKDEIKLRLYADGKPVRGHRPILVSVASDSEAAYQEWEYIFPKLPEMDREGDEYTYEIADIGYSKDTSDAVLFWLNQSGDKVLGTGRGRYDADDARLVYISYEEASGELVYEAGSDGKSEPEGIHFEMETESEEDEPYLSREKAVLSVSDQTWTLPRVLPVNPLTGEEISYRIRVSQKAKASDSENRGIEEAYEISCINDGERSEDNYLYDGGRLEITALPAGTYTAAGRIVWEDESDLYGFRPETADFLRVLDEEGSDVTDEVELSLEKTGDNFWNYRISGLSAGKSYQLTTALEHYDGEEAEPVQLSVPQKDEEGRRELALPDVIKQLKTRTVRGLIDWHGWNPKTADDSLAFLRVFYGNREVTQNVEMELLSEDTERGIWGYAVSGLAEGVEYVIRPEEVEGYTTEPEEVAVSYHLSSEESPALYGLRSAQRTLTPSAGAGLLQTISMSPLADVTLTIETRAFSENAGSSVLSQNYDYQVTVGAAEGVMSPYEGRIILYHSGEEEGIPATASEGKITLKNGQRAEIPLPSGCWYSVKQKEINNAILYDKETLNGVSRKLEGDTRLDFTNIEKKYVQFQKQWNDNGNGRGIRPTTDAYQEYLFLNAAVGGATLSQLEMEKLGITKEALKAAGFPKINDESSALRGENHWPIYYDGLPSTDEKGNILSYTLAERQVPGYAAADHLGNRNSYDDVLLNTVYRDMNVTLLWRDGKNSYGTRPGSDELLARLKDNYVIYRRTDSGEETDITGEFISASSETENPGKPYQAAVVETDENQWTLCLTNLPEYDEKGLPYTYYLKGKANSPELAPEKKEGLERAFYATEYENVENYTDRADGCYENGRMVYTLQGTIDFHVSKEWKDGEAKKEEAPDVSFQLLRYPEKQPNQDPKTAWQTAAFLKKYSYETKTDGKVTEVREENLPQFNEDGYKYIYFVRESLSGTNAGEYQRIVTNEPGYDFLTEAGLAGNRAVIVNRRKGQISVPVTKQWVSAAYQNIDARVSLKVERSTGSEAGWEALPSDGMYLDGFSAETLTRQMMLPGLEKYDKDGYLYQYRVSEGDVYFRAQGESEYHPMMVSVDEQEGRVITLLQTTREHFPDRQYQYETITGDTGNGLSITNRLTGTTELVIEKIWAGDWSKHTKPQTLSFDVYRNDSYTGRTVTMAEPWTDGAVFKATVTDLPRYDSNGAEYNYTVQERCSEGDRLGGVSYTYERLPGSWSEDGTKFTGDAWKATVVNTPPGDGRSIRVKKKWLDGGDSFCRKPVTVALYRKLKNVENSEWEATENYTTVSEKTDWVGWISAAGFNETLYDYAVAETAIGNDSNTAAPEFSVAKAGEIAAQGSITTKEHYYDFESKKLNADGTSWEITNRRTGTLSVTVQKSWVNGDASGDALPLGAEFILYRGSTEDISPVGGRKEADLDTPTVSWTDLPKYDEKGELIAYSVKEGSILAASGSETIKCSVLGGTASVHGHRYVSEVTRGEYQHGSVDSDTENGAGTYPETGDVIPYSITNRRQQQIQNFTIHKIWKDDGARRSKRPDIYFELWKEENGKLKLMEEYIGRERKEKNVANPEYHEVYVFDDIPRYTADGNEITYYAIERTHVTNTLYSGISYNASPEADGTFSMEAWENYRQKEKYEMMIPNNGTVVNIRSGETVVSGRKIWENMGGLTLENYPTVTLKLQRRYLYATPGESNPYRDVLMENGCPYICELSQGFPNYRFPAVTGAEESGFTGYPKYDPVNGREYSYYVEEASVTAGDNPEISAVGFRRTSNNTSFIIHNTFQTTGDRRIIVNKEWEG
ncbi:MAG: Cna B-type domain-containing protein, partial [Clostridium sp.]|nr:Cna B-type domain-containing protein [Clostridium sp.]